MVPADASSQSLASRRDLLIAYHDRPGPCRGPGSVPGARGTSSRCSGDGTTRCAVVPRSEPVDSWPTGLPHGSADLG